MASTSTSSDDSLAKALARVADLEAALKASEAATQAAKKELEHFVYAASHDLQEPLRAITTYSQLLERLYEHDEQTRELTGFIATGVSRMHSLLKGLLTYSRVNPSPVLSRVRLNSAVHSALYTLSDAIKQSGAVVRFSNLPEIAAHEIQMGQLFEQVLSNAIVYCRKTPEIDISSYESELDGEPAQVVKVQDNAIGIEPQYFTQVLQPFKRLHGKDFPGHGLGLAICDKIMRAHRGKLWFESDGQNGTAVYLAFPD